MVKEELEESNIDLLFRKPSAAIAVSVVSGYLTINQRKVYNSLLKDAKDILERNPSAQEFAVSLSDTLERMDINRSSPDRLKKELKKIQNIQVEWNSFEKTGNGKAWGVFSLLSEIKIQKNTITFALPPFLTNALLNLGRENPYAYIDLNTVKSLSNPYALALYEQAEDYYKTKKMPRMSIEQYRKLIGVADTKYRTRFNQFRDNLVEAPIKEVNERTQFNLSYKFIYKEGNKKPSHIDILINLKCEGDDKEASLEELNNDIFLVRSYLSVLGYKETDALKYLDTYPLKQVLFAASKTLDTKKKGKIRSSVHKTFEYYLNQGKFNDDELEKLKKDTQSDLITPSLNQESPTLTQNIYMRNELEELALLKREYDNWLKNQVEIFYNNMNIADKSSYKIHALKHWCNGEPALLQVYLDENENPNQEHYSVFLIETGKLKNYEQWKTDRLQPDMFEGFNLTT